MGENIFKGLIFESYHVLITHNERGYFCERIPTSQNEIDFVRGTINGFIVWNEVYFEIIGLYPTMFEAKANLKEYCRILNND